LLTCFSNDYGLENWIDQALSFYADKNDLLILITVSVLSKNIINGALRAKKISLPIITFSGFSSKNNLRKSENNNWMTDKISALNNVPKDPAGSGDSFLVCTAMTMATGRNIWESVYLGMVATACQLGRIGNIPLTIEDLVKEIPTMKELFLRVYY